MPSSREPDESKRIPTKKQVVAGFVVYRKTTDGIKFLLLYRRGNYWNFPKGHFKPGERSIDTALRELEEETGIKKTELRMLPNFRAYERFYFKIGNQGIYDTVILFLAEVHKADIHIEPREHSGYGWFLYHDALNVIGEKIWRYAQGAQTGERLSEAAQAARAEDRQCSCSACGIERVFCQGRKIRHTHVSLQPRNAHSLNVRVFLFCFCCGSHLLEHFRLVLCEIRQNLSIDLDTRLLERCDECAVVHALGADGGVDLDGPELAERALFFLRPRNARDQACSSASLAARSFDLRPHLKPLVALRIFSRC